MNTVPSINVFPETQLRHLTPKFFFYASGKKIHTIDERDLMVLVSGGRGGGCYLLPLQNTCSEIGSEVALIGLWEYIAVRCLINRVD
jgi:hypothetical protein